MSEKKQNLQLYMERHKASVDNALRQYLPLAPTAIKTKFNEALEYSIFSGGKRLRPVLVLLGCELVGGNVENVLPSAIAVEYIHTSSLIFDDLPCMDNAVERRGKDSLHEVYGEGLAVLVGLALLNGSYNLVFDKPNEFAVAAHRELTECIGASGMIGGQSLDLALAKDEVSAGFSTKNFQNESIRNLKTSALMRLALRIGAILSGANERELNALLEISLLLGDAYQLSDDLIDLQEDSEIFSNNQTTFAIAEGIESSKLHLKNLIEKAQNILIEAFIKSEARNCLVEFAAYLGERKA